MKFTILQATERPEIDTLYLRQTNPREDVRSSLYCQIDELIGENNAAKFQQVYGFKVHRVYDEDSSSTLILHHRAGATVSIDTDMRLQYDEATITALPTPRKAARIDLERLANAAGFSLTPMSQEERYNQGF